MTMETEDKALKTIKDYQDKFCSLAKDCITKFGARAISVNIRIWENNDKCATIEFS